MSPQVGVYTKIDADADIAAHAADVEAHLKTPWSKTPVGRYWFPYVGYMATIALAQYTLYGSIFMVPRDFTADRIAVDVTTSEVGKDIRLGVYAFDQDTWEPGALIEDFGTVDTDSIAIKPLTIDRAFTKGMYLLAAITDGTTVEIRRARNYGAYPLQADVFAGGIIMNYKAQGAPQFAALPAAFPADPSEESWCPVLGLRVASLD